MIGDEMQRRLDLAKAVLATDQGDEFTRWMRAQEIIRQGQGGRPVKHSACGLNYPLIHRTERAGVKLTTGLVLTVLALLAVMATRLAF